MTIIYFRRPQTSFVDADILQKPQSQWKLVAEGKSDDDDVLKAGGGGLGGGLGQGLGEGLGEGLGGLEASDADANNKDNSLGGSGGLDGSEGSLDGSGEKLNGYDNRRRRRGSLNDNGDDETMVEETPKTKTPSVNDDDKEVEEEVEEEEKDSVPPPPFEKQEDDPLAGAAASTSNNDGIDHDEAFVSDDDDDDDDDDDTTAEALALSLEKRLQLEVKHHPESVLLCGYFHEEIIQDDDDDDNDNNEAGQQQRQDYLTLSTYLPGVNVRELRVYYGDGVLKIGGARALYNLVQRFERSFAIDERLVDVSRLAAILHDGMLMIRVPKINMPPPPVRIRIKEATPLILFNKEHVRRDSFCLDIDVPGIQLHDLTIYYSNGILRLLWEKIESTSTSSSTNSDNTNQTTATMGGGDNNTSTSTTTSSTFKQMRFEREIPINTIQINTQKIVAYLDQHTKHPITILTIVAPIKLKRGTNMRPIEVKTIKDLKQIEGDGGDGIGGKDSTGIVSPSSSASGI